MESSWWWWSYVLNILFVKIFYEKCLNKIVIINKAIDEWRKSTLAPIYEILWIKDWVEVKDQEAFFWRQLELNFWVLSLICHSIHKAKLFNFWGKYRVKRTINLSKLVMLKCLFFFFFFCRCWIRVVLVQKDLFCDLVFP